MRAGKKWGQVCQNSHGTNIQRIKAGSDGALASVFGDRVSAYPGGGCVDFPKEFVPLYPLTTLDSSLPNWGCYEVTDSPEGAGTPSSCEHPRPGGIHAVSDACAASNAELSSGHFRYTNRMVLPRVCSPSNRVQLFVNSYPAPGVCGAAAQLAQSLALACQYNVGGLAAGVGMTQPKISKLEDLDGFVMWIGFLERQAREQVGRLYVEKVPKKVVDDYAAAKVGTGVQKGEHGAQLLELRKSLETMAGAWNRVAGDLAQLRLAVDGARIAIVGAKIDQKMASA